MISLFKIIKIKQGKNLKVVLTIAGSDSGGGAGIQADLKTFEYFGVFGASAITVLTAQNTTGVSAIAEVPQGFVTAQLKAIETDFEISAVKIGMLYNSSIIEEVLGFLKGLSNIPVVFDPVFVSKAGSKLLQDDDVENFKKLFEYCTVCTPNQFEAKELFGYQFGDSNNLRDLANLPCAVLIKNHKVEKNGQVYSVDSLFANGERFSFETPLLVSNALHGTGCSYSSAIAANLALGKNLNEAIMAAKEFVYKGILNSPKIGHGPHPILHKQN